MTEEEWMQKLVEASNQNHLAHRRIAELEAALAPFAQARWRFDDDGFPYAVVASMDIVHRARNLLGKDKADD